MKKFFLLTIILFTGIHSYAQSNSKSIAQMIVDSLVSYGEIDDTLLGRTLMFYDIDTTMPFVEFVNTNCAKQMLSIDSVCDLCHSDTLHCFRFGLFGPDEYMHMALLYKKSLHIINMRRPLDRIINDIYLHIRKQNLNDETVQYIFNWVIKIHYANSWKTENPKYNPLALPGKTR